VSLVRSKHSSSPAPSLSLITATVTVCAALAACGGAGDPNPTDVVAKSVAPEILAEPDPAVVVASAAADSRLDSVNAAAGPLEVALADATQTDGSTTPSAENTSLEPSLQLNGEGSAGQSGAVPRLVAAKSFALAPPPLTAISADWMSAATSLAARAAPAHGATVRQTPPEFSWPAVSGAASYRLEVSGPAGVSPKVVRGNWAQWSTAVFPSGAYQWRVQPLSSTGTAVGAVSSWRSFTLAADATEFRVPEGDALIASIAARGRPRSLPGNANFDAVWASRVRSERATDLATAYTRVKSKVSTAFVTEPALDTTNSTSIYTAMPGKVYPSIDFMVEEALVARIKGDATLLKDAARRAVILAGWDPNGSTSDAAQDQVNRYIASALTVVFDRAFDVLTATEKSRIRSVVQTRLKAPFDQLVASRALERMPYDSHGFTILGHIATASALMVGEGAQFDAWAKEAIPFVAKMTSPWGGEEGGFGNGAAYAEFVLAQIPTSDALRDATGIDIWRKPWGRNFGSFLTHMYPPGAPTGPFGDEAEAWREVTVNFAALARRVDQPLPRWKAALLKGVDGSSALMIGAPFIGTAPPATFVPPKAEVFADAGVVSIQTDLADPNRASLYFRSSPYGSFNHSHADQNSFILNVGTKRTFINSGVYDYYGSPEFNNWYIQSKAHNTITYDGGVGQLTQSMASKGQVTAFNRNAAGYTLTSGDAKAAYPAGVQVATRTIVAGPDGSFITVDQLSASTARRWEYNLHVPTAASLLGNGRAQVATDRGSLCVSPIAGSQAASWWALSQAQIPAMSVARYSNLMGTYQMKWVAPTAVTTAVLPMHFDFGCNSAAPAISQANGQVTIHWEGHTWVVDSGGKLISAS